MRSSAERCSGIASLLEGYRWKLLPSAKRTDISTRVLKQPNWDIVREIAGGGFDVLWVHGYAHATTWLAVAAARARGMRVLIRDEQTLLHGRPAHKRCVKAGALRALYSQASALYIGEAESPLLRALRHAARADVCGALLRGQRTLP